MNDEAERLKSLREVVEAGERALQNNDMVAARALAEKEARLMDELRAQRAANRKPPAH